MRKSDNTLNGPCVVHLSLQVLFKEIENNVGLITLNTPGKLNALSATMGDEFLEVVEHLRTEVSNVNAVVLTGAGRAFSAGGDLDFLEQRHRDTPSRNVCVFQSKQQQLSYY